MNPNPAVHRRLRERRLIAFVVAVTPVADEIDEDIALEGHAIAEREPRGRHAGLRVVGIHVKDGNLEAAREAARIQRAVGILGLGREANLVVRNDVNGAAGRVALEPVEVQGLGHDALSGERRVAMDEDGQHGVGVEHRRAGTTRIGARRARHPSMTGLMASR
jgi:hypothetical protein